MNSLKERIIILRKEGNTYRGIAKKLDCSLSTVVYNLNEKVKKNKLEYSRKRKINKLKVKFRDFLRKDGERPKIDKYPFTYEELIKKLEDNPYCYLTGKKINLEDYSSYQLDHIIPKSRGGLNTLDNLGLLSTKANKLKNNLLLEELIMLCEEILTHNNQKIKILTDF